MRCAGHGPSPVVLLAGNNCSGAAFLPLLSIVGGSEELSAKYTFFAFDYRGSGKSSYHRAVESLEDFARDFADVVSSDPLLRKGQITVVGHSMGFGVAQCMVALDPTRYVRAISLAGIGTRGVRVVFAGATSGTDPKTGRTYAFGDWADSQDAVAFQQRSWQGEGRVPETVAATWNMIVYNDILKYDLAQQRPTETSYLDDPGYRASLDDVMSTVYMPESLYASHRFNATTTALEHTNSDGRKVILPGAGQMGAFAGLDVLLVKARTDRMRWRGDLVIDDSITQNTKHDLKIAGARVTAIMIEPDTGYDHGFPMHHPEQTVAFITAFAEAPSQLDAARLEAVLGPGNFRLYAHGETEWEREAYGGF